MRIVLIIPLLAFAWLTTGCSAARRIQRDASSFEKDIFWDSSHPYLTYDIIRVRSPFERPERTSFLVEQLNHYVRKREGDTAEATIAASDIISTDRDKIYRKLKGYYSDKDIEGAVRVEAFRPGLNAFLWCILDDSGCRIWAEYPGQDQGTSHRTRSETITADALLALLDDYLGKRHKLQSDTLYREEYRGEATFVISLWKKTIYAEYIVTAPYRTEGRRYWTSDGKRYERMESLMLFDALLRRLDEITGSSLYRKMKGRTGGEREQPTR